MPSIDSVIGRSADLAPDHPAIREWDSGRELSYADFEAHINTLAAWMRAQGLQDGQTVGIHLPNSIDFLVAQFAAFRAGGVAGYINYRLSPAEALRQLKMGDAKVIITTAERAAAFRDDPTLADATFAVQGNGAAAGAPLDEVLSAFRRCDPRPALDDADAILRFTSGSTGAPKGILVSHRAWLVRAVSILAEEIPIVPRSTTMVLGPLTHQAGLFVLPTFLRQGTLLVMERFDPGKIAQILSSGKISCTQMVPTMMNLLLEDPTAREALRKSGLHRIVYGGSPVRRAVLDDALDLLPETEFVQGYGSHEAGSISYLDSANHRHPGYRSSAGRPFLAAEIRIRGAGVDGVGEIEVKAPWQPKARLTEAGRQVITDEWTPTGDLGELKDGFIFLRDRMNDVIISGGFNVYPLEVEAAIEGHPDVLGAAVVSAPDDRWGERVVAFVVPRDPSRFDDAVLREHCQQRLARYKVPKQFCSIGEIPLNANGKPDRRRLSDPLWGGRARRIN